jgi:hypothetical protein
MSECQKVWMILSGGSREVDYRDKALKKITGGHGRAVLKSSFARASLSISF